MSHENGSVPETNGAEPVSGRPEPVSGGAEPAPYTKPKKKLSPDQNCFGLLIGLGLLLLAILVWAVFLWWINPDFHPKIDPNAPRPISR